MWNTKSIYILNGKCILKRSSGTIRQTKCVVPGEEVWRREEFVPDERESEGGHIGCWRHHQDEANQTLKFIN